MNRRAFLSAASAATAAFGLRGRRSFSADRMSASQLIPGKDARLIVHTEKPAVLETPAELLARDQVTPTQLLFVRNNQQLETASTIRPLKTADWKIEVSGLVDAPSSFDARMLAGLAQVEHEMVLQCSGNGRSLFAAGAPTKGTQWGRGGMGNVRFAGVQLSTLLDHLGLKIDRQARYVTAEGYDEPAAAEQDFEHSLPLDDCLKKSLLALRLNGEPLPAIHGGPVRLVTPGYYGTMHVKWLSRLRFTADESQHTSQVPHYRTPRQPIEPGEPFTATLENSEPNWRMKVKCVVLAPVAGARLSAGDVLVEGVAFNDGEARLDAALVSTDAGRTWHAADLDRPGSPYAWYRWQIRLPLAAGKQQIWARAIDTLGRGQPADGSSGWNPHGYAWSGMEKVDVLVG